MSDTRGCPPLTEMRRRGAQNDSMNIHGVNTMRIPRATLVGIAAAAMLALAGCDVRQTQEGNVSLPEYEVEKKQAGDVTLPKYDVTTPDVSVGSKQVEVEVPKVTTEKETVTMPDIDVKTAEEKRAEEKRQQ
jgi:hypothetical protein